MALIEAGKTKFSYAIRIKGNDMPSGGTNATTHYNRGVVTGPAEIKATNVASFGESVDLFAYNEMCKMLHAKGREMIL